MSSLKDNKTCTLPDQYLSYLTIVKGRSPLTAKEYSVDCNILNMLMWAAPTPHCGGENAISHCLTRAMSARAGYSLPARLVT